MKPLSELYASAVFLLEQGVTQSLLEEMDAVDIIVLANEWREIRLR